MFGITMSNNVKIIGGNVCGVNIVTAELPAKLTSIEVTFLKTEKYFHSMKFIGETVLHIGMLAGDEELRED